MKKASFPKAQDYSHAVKAKQIASKKLDMADQLRSISKVLTNFDKKCNLDGIVEVDVSVIGEIIYDENVRVIQESGWNYLKRNGKWQFYIV
jgi:hypothetical protein